MPMNIYDNTVDKYNYVIDVYRNDNIQQIAEDFLNKVSITKNSLEINGQKK